MPLLVKVYFIFNYYSIVRLTRKQSVILINQTVVAVCLHKYLTNTVSKNELDSLNLGRKGMKAHENVIIVPFSNNVSDRSCDCLFMSKPLLHYGVLVY